MKRHRNRDGMDGHLGVLAETAVGSSGVPECRPEQRRARVP
jgi:hypothetical protein